MTPCPKCGSTSGNDWSQCSGSCPMPMSPHYVQLSTRCRIYDSPCINPTYCDTRDACCSGDLECKPEEVATRICDIPSQTLGPCDLAYGHDGEMHASCGDGFYAEAHRKEHERRQRERKESTP